MSSKKGDILVCKECGLEVTVTRSCGCDDKDCVIICCDKPMEKKGTERPRGCCCGA